MNGYERRSLLLIALLCLPTVAHAGDGFVWVVNLDDVLGSASHLGVGLLILGVALMVAEAFLPSFGAIGFLGIVAFLLGAILSANTDVLGFTLDLPVMLTVAALGALALIGLVGATLKARQRQIVSGDAGLVGSLTTITALQSGEPLGGWVQLQGEHWQVLSQAPLRSGQRVRVIARRGLTLEVAPVPDKPQPGD